MKKIKFPSKVTRKFHKTGLKFKKHSPEILLVTGIGAVVAGGVMACRATLKVNKIAEESAENYNRIREAEANGRTEAGEEYTHEDAKKEIVINRIQTGVQYVKLYAPSIALATAGVTCILASNNIIRKRNVALAAAYTAVDSSFKDYRKNVVERFGKELDRELKHGIKTKEIEEVVANEDGTEATVKSTVEVVERPNHDVYSRIFDETCKYWEKDANYNYKFLIDAQNFLNEKLQEQSFLFLNDVYETLGFDKVNYGQVVGWVFDQEHPVGDNYVDFGIWDIHDQQKRRFVNGHERSIILDFNVDGPILDLMS